MERGARFVGYPHPMTQLSLFSFEKRWSRRRERWVTPADHFRPVGYSVDVVSETLARSFIAREHYSASFPAARLSIGLWGPGPTLAGVAVFSVPMSEAVLKRWTGPDHVHAAELGRFACAPSVRFNGETWFLKRALAALRREKECRAVLSCADPLERWTLAGALTKGSHFGTIYQAKGSLFAGRARPRWIVLAPDGSVLSARTLSKIRSEERGIEYAMRQLRGYGAPGRSSGESWSTWLDRVCALPLFRRVRHPGNFAYVFGLDAPTTGRLEALHRGGLPYPKRRGVPPG
jgi:hypothetical protein